MSFTQHFAAISQVFSDCMHICSFQQYQYCEIGNVSMGFSKSLMPKILYKSLVFDSWFDKIFGICDLENPILTFPPHSIVSLSLICRLEFSAFFFFVAEQTRSQKQQQLVHVPTYRHLITSSCTILVMELWLRIR